MLLQESWYGNITQSGQYLISTPISKLKLKKYKKYSATLLINWGMHYLID
jgi:hypothetical protein